MDFLTWLGKGEIQETLFGKVLKIYNKEQTIYMSYPTIKAIVINDKEIRQ